MFRITQFVDECRFGCSWAIVYKRDKRGVFRCPMCNEIHELTDEIDKFEKEWKQHER